MFSEALKNTNYKIKIIATDINFQLLQDAKKGVYSFNTLQNLDPNLIKSYFTKEGKHQYKVNKKIKDLVTFHLGDIVTYPLSYLDVIFCRNLLIYYSKDSQNSILKKFYQVLKENEFLVLGMDESMLGHKIANSFLPIFPRERIYQKLSSTDVLSSIISEKK
jgi:chemotaxis protein methyltransferase CheR